MSGTKRGSERNETNQGKTELIATYLVNGIADFNFEAVYSTVRKVLARGGCANFEGKGGPKLILKIANYCSC